MHTTRLNEQAPYMANVHLLLLVSNLVTPFHLSESTHLFLESRALAWHLFPLGGGDDSFYSPPQFSHSLYGSSHEISYVRRDIGMLSVN